MPGRQVVRHQTLALTFAGSSPALATNKKGDMGRLICVGCVRVEFEKRKFATPTSINRFLRANKGKWTNKELAHKLNLPITQIEHYFRTDRSRAVPSPKTWKSLKKLLHFPDTYDKIVVEVETKLQTFEQTRRVYSSKGLAPTLNTIGPPLILEE